GKDSLSMRTVWSEGGVERRVVAPVSLIVSAFAPVADVRRTLTPALELDERPSSLWLIDLARGRHRLGASALAQVYGELAEEPAVVVQILAQDEPRLESILTRHGLADAALYLGAPVSELRVRMRIGTQEFDESWADLRRAWSETSWRMRRLRDDPECADEE